MTVWALSAWPRTLMRFPSSESVFFQTSETVRQFALQPHPASDSTARTTMSACNLLLLFTLDPLAALYAFGGKQAALR